MIEDIFRVPWDQSDIFHSYFIPLLLHFSLHSITHFLILFKFTHKVTFFVCFGYPLYTSYYPGWLLEISNTGLRKHSLTGQISSLPVFVWPPS